MSCNCSVTISFCSFIITTAVCLKLIQDTNPLAVRSALAVLAMRPDLHKLPACLRTYLEQQGAKSEAGNSDLANTYLVFSAVITSRLPWEADSEDVYTLETVRANPKFHGKPFHDCVSIDSGGEAPWYGQFMALFSHTAKPLAFVRYFTTASPLPAIREPIAGLLSRINRPAIGSHSEWGLSTWPGRKSTMHPHIYGVIELSSIIKRECIVPDCFGGPRRARVRFPLNPFLWARNKY